MTKEEVIKIIKDWNLDNNKIEVLSVIIPELKKSEDEKMIKFISNELVCLRAIESNSGGKGSDRYEELTNAIAWLEKQGERKEIDYNEELKKCRANPLYFFDKYMKVKLNEQKPADKAEPKFNVGDWLVCCNYEPEQIIGIRNDMYEMSNGDIRPINMIDNNHNIRLWTIRDAKDGDVLYIHYSESDSDCIFLYQNTVEIESGRNVAVAYCGIDVYVDRIDFGIQGPDCIDVRKIKPAAKEQRDLLFTKMKEAEYEWDAKDKVLRKIEQKSNWSEVDDYILKNICGLVKENIINPNRMPCVEECLTWLNSLKVRVQPQPEWSEEDEKIINSIIKNLDEGEWFDIYQADWLKSLKERMQPQSKQDLSDPPVERRNCFKSKKGTN